MASKRKDIRAAVLSLLSGNTTAGARVYTGRVVAFWRNDWPVICVYTPSEGNEILGNGPTEYERKVRVSVQLIDANVDDDAEDSIDDLAAEVEAILDKDDNWGTDYLNRVDFIDTQIELIFDEKADKHYVSCTLNFDVTYIDVVEPETPPDTASVEVNGQTVSA